MFQACELCDHADVNRPPQAAHRRQRAGFAGSRSPYLYLTKTCANHWSRLRMSVTLFSTTRLVLYFVHVLCGPTDPKISEITERGN
jgi:hypothetical protein